MPNKLGNPRDEQDPFSVPKEAHSASPEESVDRLSEKVREVY